MLIKEYQVKEFSTFLCVGRCKTLGSLKSFLLYASQLSGASILCFHILSFLRAQCREWLQSDGCWTASILSFLSSFRAHQLSIHGSGNQGGIVGCNRGTVEFCGNEGSISTGWMHAGGIVGDNTGTVRNCWNTGDVYAKTNCAGGIAGSNIKYSGNTVPVVENCWSTGSVTPVENPAVGGIVGRSKDSSQNNCYSVMKPVGQIQDENGVSTVENMEAKTLEQFASGEVAYLLGGVWGQDLDNGKTVQTVPSFDGADVYYGYFNCGSTEAAYTNTTVSAEPMEHDYENGFCEQTPDETHYEPAIPVTEDNYTELGLSADYIG